MTDILFGQSYYLRFDPKLWAAQQPYPPLGTLYAAAVMRQAGYDVAPVSYTHLDVYKRQTWFCIMSRTTPTPS